MARRPDDVIVLATAEGTCQLFSGCELTQDFEGVSSLATTVGDDGAWQTISQIFYPGRTVKLLLNDRLQFTGRFETNEVPVDPGQGAVAHIVARTKLADAAFASADPKTKFQDVSLKTFLLSLFAPLGYTEADFVFDANSDRDLITGEGRGLTKLVDLDPMQEAKAKIKPPETIREAAMRHLKRFHLSLWDGADGRIVVGAPDDQQAPLYSLRSKRGAAAQWNNLLTAHRIRDWSEVPSQVRVFGSGLDDDGDPKTFASLAMDADLVAVSKLPGGHFFRPVHIPVEGAKTKDKAAAQAMRELASRSKRKDAWEVSADGWAHWTGDKLIPYAINTTADVDIETIGSEARGKYLVHKLSRTLDTSSGGTSKLSLVAQGILRF